MSNSDPTQDADYARARATELFDNPVIKSCIFEQSDLPTRTSLLCLSQATLDFCLPAMWRVVRLDRYHQMRDGLWAPHSRLLSYTQAVRELDIAGTLPLLPTMAHDVWAFFDIFPRLETVRWSHGTLSRTSDESDWAYHLHRVIETTFSDFNVLNDLDDWYTRCYRVPAQCLVANARVGTLSYDLSWDPTEAFTGGRQTLFSPDGIAAMTHLAYSSTPNSVFRLPLRSVTLALPIDFDRRPGTEFLLNTISQLKHQESSTINCTYLGIRHLDFYRYQHDNIASDLIDRIANDMPFLRNLDLELSHGQLEWLDSKWPRLQSLRQLSLTIEGASAGSSEVRASIRPECDTFTIQPPRDFGFAERIPHLETLKLTYIATCQKSYCLAWLHSEIDSICAMMLRFGGPDCMYSLVLQSDDREELDAGEQRWAEVLLDRAMASQILRPAPGWSRVTRAVQ